MPGLSVWKFIGAAFVIGLSIGFGAGWFAYDTWADAKRTEQLESALKQAREDTRKQVEAEHAEQLQQQRDSRVSQAARREVERVDGPDWDSCPSVPSGYVRLLNQIGTPAAAAPELAGEVRGTAIASGDGY